MKIWIERAGDHSANLRIVGSFKTERDAEKAADRINGLLQITQGPQTPSPHGPLSQEVLQFSMSTNFMVSPEAVDSCQYHVPVRRIGNNITIDTDDSAIQIFLEAFISCGGRIEIFSMHDYPA